MISTIDFSMIRRNPYFRTEKHMKTQCFSIRHWKSLKTIVFSMVFASEPWKTIGFSMFLFQNHWKTLCALGLECENHCFFQLFSRPNIEKLLTFSMFSATKHWKTIFLMISKRKLKKHNVFQLFFGFRIDSWNIGKSGKIWGDLRFVGSY